MSQTEQLTLAILIGLAFFALLALGLAMYTARKLKISYYRLIPNQAEESQRLEFTADSRSLKDIPAANKNKGPRVLFFSDYHAGLNRVPINLFINSMLAVKPDIVLFGGDLATNERDHDKALQHIEVISSALLTESIPFYAVWGNHDTVIDPEALASRSIRMLRNQSTVFVGPDQRDWLLVGLDDQRTGKPDWALAKTQFMPKEQQLKLKSRVDQIPQERTLVLAHNPDTSIALPEGQLAWVFSGHYHGGQINLPFKLGYRTLRSDQAWRQGFLKGLYKHKDFGFYISRGVGSVEIPLRFFSYPELCIFDIQDSE